MVLLIKKFAHFPHKSKSKLEQPESIVFQSFQSKLSESLYKLFSDSKNGSGFISLSWYVSCIKFMQGMDRAFAKLVKDLDYPVSKWKHNLAEDFFSYTLSMLDALNSISSCISHMGMSRLAVSHAVSIIHDHPSSAVQHLKPIMPTKVDALSSKEFDVGSFNSNKEKVIHEAMVKMRGVDLYILRVLLYGLSGARNADMSILVSEEYKGLDIGFGDNLMVIKEVEEVNEAVKEVKACLIDGMNMSQNGAAEELKKKLSEFESLLEMVEKEVNCLFSEVLARRNELIDCLRLPNCT